MMRIMMITYIVAGVLVEEKKLIVNTCSPIGFIFEAELGRWYSSLSLASSAAASLSSDVSSSSSWRVPTALTRMRVALPGK